jgi:Kef-type K+ transport system membrane component KefB
VDALIDGLSELGLAMLVFLAGYEIEFGEVRGDTLRRSVGAWVIIAMALLLSGRDPARSTALLAVFAALAAGAVYWALRPRPPWFSRVIAKTLHSGGQFAVRFVFLLLFLVVRGGPV